MIIHTWKLRQNIKHFMLYILYNIFKLLPIKQNKVIFTNYYGLSGYSDNLKYIAEELLKEKKIKLYWSLVDKKKQIPDGIKKIKFDSVIYMYHMATAKFWVNSQRVHWYTRKRKNQFYIQTWHGCLGLKKIELDAVDTYKYKNEYIKERSLDSKSIDLFVSGATWFTNIIRTAFKYTGEVLEIGTPRNDILVNKSINRGDICQKLDISSKYKIALYAPTYRVDESSLDAFDLDYVKLVSELKLQTGEDWVLLIRLHPRLAKISQKLTYQDTVINVSNYPDMQELLCLSDVLITDYSSCIFDFSIQKKPGFIYASDIEEYKKDRNFYLDITKLPFNIATNTDELIRNIVGFNEKKYREDLESFFDDVGLCESGNASIKVVDIIKNKVL